MADHINTVVKAVSKQDSETEALLNEVYGKFQSEPGSKDKFRAANAADAAKLDIAVTLAYEVARNGKKLTDAEKADLKEGFRAASAFLKSKGQPKGQQDSTETNATQVDTNKTPPAPNTAAAPANSVTPAPVGLDTNLKAKEAINLEIEKLNEKLAAIQEGRKQASSNPIWDKAEAELQKTIKAAIDNMNKMDVTSKDGLEKFNAQSVKVRTLLDMASKLDTLEAASDAKFNQEEQQAYQAFLKTIQMMQKVKKQEIALVKAEHTAEILDKSWEDVLAKELYKAQAAATNAETKAIEADTKREIASETADNKVISAELRAEGQNQRDANRFNQDARQEALNQQRFEGAYAQRGDLMAITNVNNSRRVGRMFIPNLQRPRGFNNNPGIGLLHGLAQGAVTAAQIDYGRTVIDQTYTNIQRNVPVTPKASITTAPKKDDKNNE
jgi:hypothetical protein